MTELTPMMRQYMQLKEQHPGTLLFFQLGEFYETFFEDAETAARELDIVLTQRDGTPMAGVPTKKADVYINRLLKRGIKVAVCDQVSEPQKGKGIVARSVTRVVTPGTVVDEDVLQRDSNNYLVAVFDKHKTWALALCDLSTGEFRATSFSEAATLLAELSKLAPAELLFPTGFLLQLPAELERVPQTRIGLDEFDAGLTLAHFEVASSAGLGLSELESEVAGGLLSYLKQTQNELAHLERPKSYSTEETLRLDPFTVRNLELVRPLRDGDARATLLGVLNQALTGMGQRLLRHWLLNPLLDASRIEDRLDAVQTLVENGLQRSELRETLKGVYDVERLVGRLGSGRSTPRDLLSLKQSLTQLPDLWLQLKELHEKRATAAFDDISSALENVKLRELAELLESAIRDDAPPTLKEGGVLRHTFHPELQALLDQEQRARQQLLSLEVQERQHTGINSLKVSYNTVFGYFIEVPRSQAEKVPPHYQRKQTLSNAERYITPELKTLEEKILAAQQRSRELEYRLFCQVRDEVAEHSTDLQTLAKSLATLDVFAALAHVAQHHDYVRPTLGNGHDVRIKNGRHPVVETLMKGQAFVPNDLTLDDADDLVILTGPNMSGKSTYLRQMALIALMAQMGSFVPAEKAQLPLFDQIFTRVGASDMLAGGHSTFMVEMLETANILNNATRQSLVLLDEMGRGTSTFDGVSIAWAVAEHLVKAVKAKTLFATHYHELTQLSEQLSGVVNMHVQVKEYAGDIIFLHQIAPGAAAGSYGIHVAKLAGLPPAVIAAAETLLKRILAANPLEAIDEGKVRGPRVIQQLALFRQDDHPVIQTLSQLDVNSLSPMEALAMLARLKEQL